MIVTKKNTHINSRRFYVLPPEELEAIKSHGTTTSNWSGNRMICMVYHAVIFVME